MIRSIVAPRYMHPFDSPDDELDAEATPARRGDVYVQKATLLVFEQMSQELRDVEWRARCSWTATSSAVPPRLTTECEDERGVGARVVVFYPARFKAKDVEEAMKKAIGLARADMGNGWKDAVTSSSQSPFPTALAAA